MFRYYPSICSLSVTFIVKWCCVLTKLISEAIEKIMWFLYFSPFLWWILLIDLSRLNHNHITSRASLVMMNAFYVIFEFRLTVFYWKKIHWCLLWRLICNFHLYITSFSSLFRYQGNVFFTKQVWKTSSHLYLWKNWNNIIWFFLKKILIEFIS